MKTTLSIPRDPLKVPKPLSNPAAALRFQYCFGTPAFKEMAKQAGEVRSVFLKD